MDAIAPIILESSHGDRHAVGERHPVRLRATNFDTQGRDLFLIVTVDGPLVSPPYHRPHLLRASQSEEITVQGDPPTTAGTLDCRVSVEIQTMDRESLGTWRGRIERPVEPPRGEANINTTVNISGGAISAGNLVNNDLGAKDRTGPIEVRYDEQVNLKPVISDRRVTRVHLAGSGPNVDLHVHATLPLVIGRATDETAHVIVDARLGTVSRRHCHIERRHDGGFAVAHLSSTNPTRVDGHVIGERKDLPTDRSVVLQLGQDQGGPDPSSFLCTVIPIACGGLAGRVDEHLREHGHVPAHDGRAGGVAGVLVCVHDPSGDRVVEEHLVVLTAVHLHDLPQVPDRPGSRSIEDYPRRRSRGSGLFRCPQGGIQAARLDDETGQVFTASTPSPDQRVGEYRVV